MPSPDRDHDVCAVSRSERRVLPYGEHALLVELANSADVVAYTDALRDAMPLGVLEVVPAARTVLVRYDPLLRSAALLQHDLAAIDSRPRSAVTHQQSTAIVVIDVHYDGEDLHDIATRSGLSIDNLVNAHQAAVYRSA